jgi:hypothetical protein
VTLPPPKPLRSETTPSPAKLLEFDQVSTDVLRQSLAPGEEHSLKTRPDGTIVDGLHRVHILRSRGIRVDALPREIVARP